MKYVIDMKEIWKPIKTSEEYFISNYGNVKRNNKIIKSSIWSLYRVVRLKLDNKYKTYYIHRLVAEAFIPNPQNKKIVNHKDCNKLNNNVNNLEWVTKQENEIHAWNNGCKEKIRTTSIENSKKARTHINNKIAVLQYDLEGNFIKEWISSSNAMRELKIDASAIIKCCRGKLKRAGGYRWKYKNMK